MKKASGIILMTMLLATMCTIVADNTVVIVRNSGKPLAIKTHDIDSLAFANSDSLPSSMFDWQVHDTITVIKKEYQSITEADSWYVNVENPVVTQYMNEVDYSGYENDYTFTKVSDYESTPATYRKDEPRGVQVIWSNGSINQRIILSYTKDFSIPEDTIAVDDSVTSWNIMNLVPGKTYYYRVINSGNTIVKESHFTTVGQVRMMYLPSLYNVRDLGGWATDDGKHIKYCRIFRGGEMNTSYLAAQSNIIHHLSSEDSIYIHDKMKIRLDMDLRDNRDLYLNDTIANNNLNYSVLGNDVEYYNEQVNYNTPYMSYYSSNYAYRFGRTLSKIIATLKNGGNVYLHCTWGADRTGTVAMLIEGLCGVSESDISKDYELTDFTTPRNRTKDYWSYNLNIIKCQNGNTLKEKFATYCRRIGVTDEEINELRSLMIE